MLNREVLVNRILSASGIVGHNLRSETAREIAAHIDDIIEEERAAGRQDSEIEQLIARRFGNVDEIAREFATVYRARRATLSFVSYSLLAFISIVATSAFVYSIQYGATRWLGGSMAKVFNRSH